MVSLLVSGPMPPVPDIFLQTGDAYHEVTSDRSLLALFTSQRKEIRKYMRNKGISFKINPEDAVVGVAEYLGRLTK